MAGAVVASRVNVFVCVGPVNPVRRGRSASAVRPSAGVVTVGATAVTGAIGATGLSGNTVT